MVPYNELSSYGALRCSTCLFCLSIIQNMTTHNYNDQFQVEIDIIKFCMKFLIEININVPRIADRCLNTQMAGD